MISTTYGTAYISLAGALIVLFTYFGVNIGSADSVANLIGAIVVLAGAISTMIHRHTGGGVNIVGVRNAESDK